MNRLLLAALLVLCPAVGWADTQTHATNCLALTCDAGRSGQTCYEIDDDHFYVCDSDGPAWVLVATATDLLEDTVEAYIFDADAESVTGVWEWQDGIAALFGTTDPTSISHDGSDFYLTNTVGDILVDGGNSTKFANAVVILDGGLDIQDGSTNSTLFTYDTDGNSYFSIRPDANRSTFIGHDAGIVATAAANVAIGSDAGKALTNGDLNVMLGAGSGQLTTTGNRNVYIGTLTADDNVAGSDNTIIGYGAGGGASAEYTGATMVGANAGNALTTGINNLFFGKDAGQAVTTGGDNTIFSANTTLTTGSSNLLFGRQAFVGATTTSNNIGIGPRAGYWQAGSRNIAIGVLAMQGVQGSSTADDNVVIGDGAGGSITTGDDNVILGTSAGPNITTGPYNITIGRESATALTTSTGTIAIGFRAVNTKTTTLASIGIGYASNRLLTGASNIGIGSWSLEGSGAATGNSNVAIGENAGDIISTGSRNIFLGHGAARDNTTQDDMLIIDNRDQGSYAATLTDAIIVGVMNAAPASQTLTLNAKTTNTYDLITGDSFQAPVDDTLAADGEITVDDTDDQFKYRVGTADHVLLAPHTKCFTLPDPVAGDSDIPLWIEHPAITVTSMRCIIEGGTNVVGNLKDADENALDSMTCTVGAVDDDGTIANATFAAGEGFEWDTDSQVGTPNWLNFCWTYTIDAT